MAAPKFVASVSFGKDSIATLLLAKEHGEPLDEAVYCEVMFDKTISGEVPEHRDFIYDTAIPRLEQMGIRIIVLRSEKTYVDLFTGRVTRGPKKGMVRSFPVCGRCAVQRDCKARPLQRYQKTLPPGTVTYIGIAQDEQERLLRLEGGRQVSLLDKYNFTEQDAWQLCKNAGLLSPVYEFTDRGGCWFCPNAKRRELRHLYDHHPDLWARMLELQALPGKVTEKSAVRAARAFVPRAASAIRSPGRSTRAIASTGQLLPHLPGKGRRASGRIVHDPYGTNSVLKQTPAG